MCSCMGTSVTKRWSRGSWLSTSRPQLLILPPNRTSIARYSARRGQFLAGAGRWDEERIPLPACLDRRGVRQPWSERPGLYRRTPIPAELAVRREQGGGRSLGARLFPHLWPAGAYHQLLEQLRAVSAPGKTHSARYPECPRRQAAADLWRWPAGTRLAVCRGSLHGHQNGSGAGSAGRDL